jgi:hypothetical protein
MIGPIRMRKEDARRVALTHVPDITNPVSGPFAGQARGRSGAAARLMGRLLGRLTRNSVICATRGFARGRSSVGSQM